MRRAQLTKQFLLVVLVFAVAGCRNETKLKSLFDGKTLKGWKQLGGKALYEVEDGAIVGTSVRGTPNSFLCTEKTYGDFILEFEVKVDPPLNSGVQIRSNSLKQYRNGRVHGYQVEIDPSERAYSGGIYDEAGRAWLNDLKDNEAARKAFNVKKWNHYRIEAIGDSMRTWVNGVPAADLVDSMTQTGFIGLQVHLVKTEKPLTVRWRRIRIQDLGSHIWQPLFDGRSLQGWHTLPGGKWEVQDGVIAATSSKDEKRHGMLVSDKRYGDFTARLKFKVERYGDFTARLKFKVVQGNSGFYFRVDKVESNVGVHGFQAEVAANNDIGGLYETGGRAWVIKPKPEEVKKFFKPGQWNQMTVSAHGRRIVVHVNGHKTAELKDDPGRLQGHLALQLHGGQDMNVMFKDIEMLVPKKQLGAEARAYGAEEMPLVFETDFEDGKLDAWQAVDAKAWRIEDVRGGKALALFGKSDYKPQVRSPLNLNFIKDISVGSFVLELKMLSTTKDYAHRDLCLFFGHQNPSHFYYVHIANKSDAHSNSIFAVDGKPRVSIAKTRTAGTKWDEKWHTVRLVRDVRKGTIEVFLDDTSAPIMTAVDKRFARGRIGVGSFDDTGRFDDIRLWGREK
ncbi:MAG: 3-keto-disaccharide hydrolase [Planctomycetota bacterium]